MDDFPVRSMTTLSSAFMSSSRARTVWSVSLAVGCRETVSGVRRDARESAGVCRVCDPFYALHSPRREPGDLKKHNYLVRFFLPRLLPVLAPNLDLPGFVPRFLSLAFALEDLLMFFAFRRERSGFPLRLRRARSAGEDKGDLTPCRNVHAGGL